MLLECAACTYHNQIGNNVCEICDSSLSSARKIGAIPVPIADIQPIVLTASSEVIKPSSQNSSPYTESSRMVQSQIFQVRKEDVQPATFRDWTPISGLENVVHDCTEEMLIPCIQAYPVTSILQSSYTSFILGGKHYFGCIAILLFTLQ